jgi:hypothetical protein
MLFNYTEEVILCQMDKTAITHTLIEGEIVYFETVNLYTLERPKD